jgi:diguanylate cyclase (GGDEF)-like protein
MTVSDLSLPSDGALPESEYARQLRSGFKFLRFVPALEAEFRSTHRRDSQRQVRLSLWLAVLFIVTFSVLSSLVFDETGGRWLNIVRYAVFAPLLGGALIVAYSSLYQRWYASSCQIGAVLFGAGVVLLEIFAARQGAGVMTTVVIATLYCYLMLSLLFYAALRTGFAILCMYIIAAVIGDLSRAEVMSNITLLVFANVIGATVAYSLERASRTSYLEEHLLIEMASRDGLTGIFNRRTFDDRLEKVWQQAARDRVPLALLLIDIDHFKPYNDSCGHVAGDECLRRVARCLERAARRPLDLVARYGGEEFAILLYGARSTQAEDAARRLQLDIQSLNIRHPASSAGPRLTVSVGGASVDPKLGRSHVGFVQLADEALYDAKGKGRNRIVMMEKEYEQLTTGSFRNPRVA